MKKTFIALGLGLSLLSFLTVSAAEYAKSDIDLQASTVKITISNQPAGAATFSCLNETSPHTYTFEDNPSEAHWDDPNNDGNGTFLNFVDCFHAAGDYRLDIKVIDQAGNDSVYVETFTIKPGTPVGGDLNGNCDDATANNGQTENGKCKFSLILKDQYGNTATNQSPKVYSNDSDFPIDDDANEGVKFRDGLRISKDDSSWVELENTNAGNNLSNDNEFWIKAFAPSIKKELISGNTFLSRLVSPLLKFVFTNIKKVNVDGSISADSVDDVEVKKHLTFKNPFSAEPEITNTLEHQAAVGVTVHAITANDPTFISGGSGIVKTFDIKETLCKKETTTTDGITTTILTECDLSPEDLKDEITSFSIFEIQEKFLQEPDSSTIGSDSVALTTEISYKLGDKVITYIAGAIGGMFDTITTDRDKIIGLNSDDISAKFIGADIEGFVSVKDNESVLGTESDQILNIGLNSNKTDIYEEIVKNGFELVRNAAPNNVVTSNAGGNDLINLFNGKDVVIVKSGNLFEIGNASNDIPLPSGKKTLVLVDTNLKINGNLIYQNPNDSFGVIVLRTAAGTEPAVGNIFVASDVKKIAGSYFADGGFMNNTGSTIATGNKEGEESHYQLLLEGSLLSRNTLGGSLRGQDSNTSALDYTPWGETTDNAIARRYDLHYVRRYDYEIDNVSPTQITGEANNAAFIIRPDQKATILPPPGFKIQ